MQMRSIFTLVLLALCSLTVLPVLVLARPPPPPTRDILVLTQPTSGTYKVGDELHVKADIKNEDFKKKNPKVDLYIQKSIQYPQLNEHLGSIHAKDLAGKGFKATIKKEWLIKKQANIAFRVRAHWDSPKSGYVDSDSFKLLK
ncbi:hypothetical protein EC973_004856 [Apophysomyces ossiformis]|uniref:Uncharacterized protein n=1 Tax=Apophysomyces ossiformis TaxID=679940 RepID=A0A8H7BPP7_9FUNG|nr:hypothetical protein EC973_004856 [Apophysomyces ossiformis]